MEELVKYYHSKFSHSLISSLSDIDRESLRRSFGENWKKVCVIYLEMEDDE